MRSVIRIREERQEKRAKTVVHIKPYYSVEGTDLMFKGNDFYAVYLEENHLWSKDPQDFIRKIDEKLEAYCMEKVNSGEYIPVSEGRYFTSLNEEVIIDYVKYSYTNQLGTLTKWMKDIPRNFRYTPLDMSLTFPKDVESLTWSDYRSKTLPYDIHPGRTTAYNRLMSTLYSPDNREKIEWAIGSVLVGDSKRNDKMIAIYGEPGTGKSTVLDIIKKLFEGYWVVFVASNLANKNNQFSLAAFKDNPLVAIQDDGNLSRIETERLNELISHAEMEINEKQIRQYTIKPNAILFMATNENIDIHDTNEGIVRRLLDVYPTGKQIPYDEYMELKEQVLHELGAIAAHCVEVYKKLGRKYYQNYIPEEMIQRTNYTYNFMNDLAYELEREERVKLSDLYQMYKHYFEECGLKFPLDRIRFAQQAERYFNSTIKPDAHTLAGVQFEGFKKELFMPVDNKNEYVPWLTFNSTKSLLDDAFANHLAQYANKEGTPKRKWENVTTKLADIDTSKLHYVRVDPTEIVIDFDIKDENGEKSFEKNFEAARVWPETYAELSKSGKGIHLHYLYTGGDPTKLASIFADDIEIKVYTGNSSLRRQLTLCNAIPIATIDGTNLPKKKRKESSVLSQEDILTEQRLRSRIVNCLLKKHHGHTKPEVDYIKHSLDQIYASGQSYDVTDMRKDVMQFCMQSSHQRDACLQLLSQMKFCSDDVKNAADNSDDERPIIFFDIEVFPNLLLVCWKLPGDENKVRRMFNPTAFEIEDLVTKYRLIGFNNKSYDNQILYFRMMGGSIEGCYDLSQAIIVKKTAKPNYKAYALSYTDIYDYLVGDHRKGLKKIEIELGIHHQELDMDWDKPVPEDKWDLVADYCDNDVIATEAAFNSYKADFVAREILADISGLTVNDSTNSHTQQIIFGDVKNPQGEFANVDLSKEFPGYTFDCGKSWYRGEEPGEGGYVYAEPGIYYNVALLDIASMHPTSLEVLNLFGPYTKNFSALKQIRLYIKHGDFESAGAMFDGRLKKYLTNKEDAKNLSLALKIAINSVYGLTSASFANRCKPINNVDNVVAKRGALFMINLKHEVQERGFTVAHIKTDSIKIPNATPEIIQFVMEYGQKYGYTFEHEATYRKMALVNDAVYIAQYDDGHWTATGAQFQHPYVFKTLFSHEPLIFEDHVEVKSVTKGTIYLDMNEDLGPDEHRLKFVGRVGAIVPIKPGRGGGVAVRKDDPDDKPSAVTGTKGYRWLESEEVKVLKKEDDIDISYFEELDRKAIENINKAGEPFGITFDDFVSEVAPDFMNKPE